MVRRRIYIFILRALFGQSGVDGYYVPSRTQSTAKNYVFASVFPNRTAMEIALEEDAG